MGARFVAWFGRAEKKFLLVGVRDKTPVFNVTTSSGELITGACWQATRRLICRRPLSTFPSTANGATGSESPRRPPRGKGQRCGDRGRIPLGPRHPLSGGEPSCETSRTISDRRWSFCRQQKRRFDGRGERMGDVRVPGRHRLWGTARDRPVSGGQMFLGVEMPGAQQPRHHATGAKPAFPAIWLSRRHRPIPSEVVGWCRAGSSSRMGSLERSVRGRPSHVALQLLVRSGFSVDEKTLLDVVTQFEKELVKSTACRCNRSWWTTDGTTRARGCGSKTRRSSLGGFRALSEKMAALGGHMGIWISPLGGYGGAEERTAWRAADGADSARRGLDLASPTGNGSRTAACG